MAARTFVRGDCSWIAVAQASQLIEWAMADRFDRSEIKRTSAKSATERMEEWVCAVTVQMTAQIKITHISHCRLKI